MWIRIEKFVIPQNNNGADKGGPKGLDKADKGFEFLMNQKKQFDRLKERAPEFSNPDLYRRLEGFGKKGQGSGKMGSSK